MGISEERSDRPERDRDYARRPDNLIGLFSDASADGNRTIRIIALICAPIIACSFGIALITYSVVVAAKGLHGFTVAYIPPAAIFSGASLVTGLTLWVKKKIAARKSGPASDGKQASKHSPALTRGQGQPQRKRRR
jgi:hypothetical protein